MDDATRRNRWRQYHDTQEALHAAWASNDYQHPPPLPIPFPGELIAMECGARTRAGTPCKRRDLYRNGRCKLHGGLSTGPRTTEGKAITSRNADKVRKRTP